MLMKNYLQTKRSKLLLLSLFALIAGANQAEAKELTIYESATGTSCEIPLYAYNADTSGDRSEFVVPSSMLSAMSGNTITDITFYCANFSWGTKIPKYMVYVKEVESATLSDFVGDTDATIVYEGELSVSGNLMTFTFTTPYEYKGGNLLVGTKVTTTGSYVAKPNSTFYGNTDSEVTCSRFSGGNKYFIPKTTFTYVNGPDLTVKDGSTKLTSPYSYNFGITTAGTTKTFTLCNPGTASLDVSVSKTGVFGATLSATTIAAGNEVTLTVTMPEATGSSTVTITPDASSGVDPFIINVSGTVKDPNKVYLDFADGQMPEGWTSVNTGSYDYYDWTAKEGYVQFTGGPSYKEAFTSPKLTFAANEEVLFEVARYSSSSYTPALTVEFSVDGSNWNTYPGIVISEENILYGTWTAQSVSIPSTDVKYIRFNGYYLLLRNIYGGELPQEPKMVVTQPASLDFGAISENTTKTFTIANTGRATLEGINVTSSNSAVFSISGAPTSLEAGASQEVTITMGTAQTGGLSSEITVSATGMEDVTFTVTGAVVPEGLMVVDFNDNQLPAGWGNNASSKWSFADGKAYCTYSSELTTPKLQFAEGDLLVISATSYDDYDNNYLEIYGSADGTNWDVFEAKKYISRSQIPYGSYANLIVTGIPTTTKYLKFKGYYVRIDEIAGLTYAPNLAVTLNEETVASPTSYDFGEKLNENATVTYNFANVGAGTINITNVVITGDGAAAYSTNWTASVAVPFDLVITRTYDGTRTGVQEAVVTVTTSDGDFVINVSGSDQGLNAPELSIDATPIDFGRLTANDTKTVTVTNAGTGQLTVNIASDNELFTVSPAQLTDIAAGESKTFDVTFNYSGISGYGAQTANITVTPTYDETANVIISAMAYAKNPNVWSEEFADADIEARGWTKGNWSITDGKAVGNSGSGYLYTPYLEVTDANEELTVDYEITSSFGAAITYQVSTDRGASWSAVKYYPTDYAKTYQALPNGDKGTFTITVDAVGVYQFRFQAMGYNLDNFEGFKRFVPAHDAEITAVDIPTNGYENREYTTTVTVKEKLGKEETATATLYFGDNMMATAEMTLTANAETTAELSFTPTEAMSTQTAKIVVTYEGGELTSTTKSVTINAVVVYAETAENTINSGTNHIVLNRTFINGWNTICLPFTVSDPVAVFGEGIKVYEFNSYSTSDGLGFKAIKLTNGMEAKTPYLLYIPETIDVNDLKEIFFPSAWVSTGTPNVTKNNVNFTGTYAPITAGNLPAGSYVLTPQAKIAKAGSGASLKAFRAYFTTTGEARMTINFDDNTTAIGAITTDGELEVGTLYNLKGQKVKGNQKGLYIINGKKVVVK